MSMVSLNITKPVFLVMGSLAPSHSCRWSTRGRNQSHDHRTSYSYVHTELMGGTTLKLTSGLVSLSGCHEHGRRPGADQEVETAERDTSKVLFSCVVLYNIY